MTGSDSFLYHEPPRPCSYLPDQTAALEYRFFRDVTPQRMSELLRRGWRRMGTHFFRPRCPNCVRCRSIRVDVEAFSPSKSQRRTLKRNPDVRAVLGRPSLSVEQIGLFNAYHADMQRRRGWPDRETTPPEYAESFLAGDWKFAYEVQYRQSSPGNRKPDGGSAANEGAVRSEGNPEAGALLGIGLIDIVPDAISSIYFYHAPTWRDQGPGTFSILHELDLARQLKKRWLYLGYWIAECPSMAYKNSFTPHEILKRHVADDEQPVWEPVAK